MIRLNSIQSRLTMVALAIIIGSSLAVGYTGYRLTSRFLSQGFHESFNLLAANMAGNAELGVMIDDHTMLNRLVEAMLAQKYVRAAIIYDARGKTLARAEAKPDRTGGEKLARIKAPIMSLQMRDEGLMLAADSGRQETVGYVELRYSLRGLQQLKYSIARQFLLISLALVVVAAAIYWFMARLIAAPLTNLVNVSRQVSRGEMNLQADGGRFHETRILAQTFNEMLTALQRQRRELEKVNEEMSRQRTLAEIGKFSLMMAHEVKNPLAIIRGSLDILKKGGHDQETTATLYQYLDEEISRINQLMEDFLLFARPKTPSFAPVEMESLVKNLVTRMELANRKRGVQLKTRIHHDACVVHCDAQLLERAMGNLVKNAMDVSKSGQKITLDVALNKERWFFHLEDEGPGIAEENLAEIFEPFFTTKAKGTGLGLALTREIILSHGGRITAGNLPERGAYFTFWIPQTPPGSRRGTGPGDDSRKEQENNG